MGESLSAKGCEPRRIDPDDSSREKRADLVKKYIRGVGIELGTLHQPLDVPRNVSVYHVDRLSYQQNPEHYPEAIESEITQPDIVGDVQELKSIDDETFDFCIANHVLESMSDPLGAITNWLRVLKPGGILYISFSEKSIRNLLSHLLFVKKDFFREIDFIEDESDGVKEYILILEKDTFLDKIFEILEETKYNDIKNTRVDVIIPVFNAYSEFIKCLYSTLKYSNNCNIIIINDKSTDTRISELFSKLSAVRLNRLIVIENNQNLGFVKTTNIGMKLHDRDIILLNSDTIVTPRWVDELQKCAYSDEKIGTVTPFTNNGTICAIPNFCTKNQIPEGFTIDSFSEFLGQISFRRFPELPTAVGFCMYIKRELINDIGYFDEEAFGKGYGEENDFSLRAIRKGYKNVLCDNVFIFHEEGSSFSSEKDELCKKHTDVLTNMYPNYLAEVAKFCLQNPLRELHDNIKFRIPSWNSKKKPRILFILHNLGGGTERHVMDIIESLNKDYMFYILQIKGDQIILSEYNNGNILKYNFLMPRQLDRFEVHNKDYKKRITEIINTFQINIVHVHHLIGHTLDIFDVAYINRIPIIFSIHDYYAICPRINLLNEKSEYCQDSNNSDDCSFCLSETLDLPSDFIKIWRNEFDEIIKRSNIIIAPNISVLDILNNYYTIHESKSLIVEHGHKKELIKKDIPTVPEVETDFKDKKFNVAYIGVLALHKGSEIFYKLASSEKLKNRVKCIIIGFSDLYNNPGYYPEINTYVHGRYNDFNELKNIIQRENINLAVFPSICPETFSFTLSEAWACEVPALVSNIGALKERVERTGGGWTADVSDVRSFETKILEIMGSKEDYQRKKDAVKDIKLMSLNRVMTEYKELYKKCISQSYPMYDQQFVLSNLELFQSFDENFSTIRRLDSTIWQLRTDICERDNRISNLADQLRERDDQISALKLAIDKRDNQISTLSNQLQKAIDHANFIESELSELRRSIVWKIVMMYHNGFVERIMPSGTNSRRMYDLLLKSGRVFVNEGLGQTSVIAKDKLLNNKILGHENTCVFETISTIDKLTPLSLENELSCRFIIPLNEFNEVKIFTATFKRQNSELDLTIRQNPDGKIIRKANVKGYEILDNGYTSFKFRPIKDSAGKPFFLSLKSKGTPSAAVWFNPKYSSDKLQIYMDDKKLEGSINIKTFVKLRTKDPYEAWIIQHEPTKEALIEDYAKNSISFKYIPKISIIMPVWNTEKKWLISAIDSVLNQIYENWELCIADGGSTIQEVKDVLEIYSERDPRIKVNFLPENKGISGNSKEASSLATGEFIALLDHDDELAPFALYEVVKAINRHPEVDFIYSDRDKISVTGKRFDPFFKPDWSPDYLLSQNYLCHLTVTRKKIFDEIGGFREGYDGSQDHDLFLRVTEATDKIIHIPKVLYHWRSLPYSAAGGGIDAKPYAVNAAIKALQDSIRRRGWNAIAMQGSIRGLYRVVFQLIEQPRVSIIIPSKDKVDILEKCINSILCKTTYDNYEIVIVDNRSSEAKTYEYYKKLASINKIKLLNYENEFNFSEINNYAVQNTHSEYIVFLNNDTEIITSNWIELMVGFAQRKEIGAVGVKLLYPNGTIQHGGLIIDENATVFRVYHQCPGSALGYGGGIQAIRNVSSVAAACMMVRRDVFYEVGEFDPAYTVAHGDIDFCLKLRDKGYLIVYEPHVELYHHESLTRGYEDTPEKRERFDKETKYLLRNWSHVIERGDPYLNPNLNPDYSIKESIPKLK